MSWPIRLGRAQWSFTLHDVAANETFSVSDDEPYANGERLELLAVVRGLEALEEPTRVTLLTAQPVRAPRIATGPARMAPQPMAVGAVWSLHAHSRLRFVAPNRPRAGIPRARFRLAPRRRRSPRGNSWKIALIPRRDWKAPISCAAGGGKLKRIPNRPAKRLSPRYRPLIPKTKQC